MGDDKELLKKAEDNFGKLEELGYKLQEQGMNLVGYSKLGKQSVSYLSEEVDKYKQFADKYPDFRETVHGIASSIVFTCKQTTDSVKTLYANMDKIDYAVLTAGTSATSLTTAAFVAKSNIDCIAVNNSSDDIYGKFKFKEPDFKQPLEDSEVDKYLSIIDPRLLEMRKSAWQALDSNIESKRMMAAHMMRSILEKLIQRWASNEDVKKAEWWECAKGTKDGVSLRQRIRFLVYGPKNEVKDEKELELIESHVNTCYKHDEYLKKVAHGSNEGSGELIESTMYAMANTILLIIQTRRKYFGDLA